MTSLGHGSNHERTIIKPVVTWELGPCIQVDTHGAGKVRW
jgi:hypothetical protein